MSCNPGRLAFAPMVILLGLIPAQSVGQTSDAAQKIFKHYFETKLQDEPEFATTTGHYENADKWNDWSKAGRYHRDSIYYSRLQIDSTFRVFSMITKLEPHAGRRTKPRASKRQCQVQSQP